VLWVVKPAAMQFVDLAIKGIVKEPRCLSLAIIKKANEGMWEMHLISWETALIKQGIDDPLGKALRDYFSSHHSELANAMEITCGEKGTKFEFPPKKAKPPMQEQQPQPPKQEQQPRFQDVPGATELAAKPAGATEPKPAPIAPPTEKVPEKFLPKGPPIEGKNVVGKDVLAGLKPLVPEQVAARHCLDVDSESIGTIGTPFC
jgi:hypothetical protein